MVGPTLNVNISRAGGALPRGPNDKVHVDHHSPLSPMLATRIMYRVLLPG